ncbi:MAG: PHP domain-containing protein [Phycisphaeraceae bacterium]|nr:PHP domain-containing protein [Phycisphaeraceae bacterium]
MKALEHPYQNLDQGQWLKGNLHTHSNHSDGVLSHQAMVDLYAARGYDFLAFTDHDRLTDESRYALLDRRGLILIPGNEITAGGPHLLHLNAQRLVRPIPQRQAVIDHARHERSMVIVNHPNQGAAFDHCPMMLMRQWMGFVGIEIYNGICGVNRGSPYAMNKWDMVLADGHRVWGLATDDAHDATDVGRGWVMALARERDLDGVMDALIEGRFYASTGVLIRSIEVHGMTIRVEAPNAQRIVAVATGGKRVAVADGPRIELVVPDRVRYVRLECWGAGETFAWTQPFFVGRAVLA